MDNYKLETLRAKPETKKYAFELANIPKETEYLKVLLPYNTATNRRVLPADTEGETFNHIFGTNANMFESFVTQRNIMGPCWLEIQGGILMPFEIHLIVKLKLLSLCRGK